MEGSKYPTHISCKFESEITACFRVGVDHIHCHSIQECVQSRCSAVLLFSNFNKILFGYFDAENTFFDNENK